MMATILNTLLEQQSPEAVARRRLATIAMALDNARDYFKEREDVKGDAGDIPNEEMTLCLEIERAQSALEAIRREDEQPITFGR